MKKILLFFAAFFLTAGFALAQEPLKNQLNPKTDPKNEKQAEPGKEAPPAPPADSKTRPPQPPAPPADTTPSNPPPDLVEDVPPPSDEIKPEEPEPPAPAPNPVAEAKRQLIKEGYMVCAQHETFGAIYCHKASDRYVYIDSDGIVTPVDKSLVVQPSDEKPTDVEPGDEPRKQDPPSRVDPVRLPKAKEAVPALGATEDKYLIASYPLRSNGNDATGKQRPVDLTKTRFQDNAVWCPAGDAYANQVQTPRLAGLNLDALAISIDFMASEVRAQPIVIAGRGCRWLGAEMAADGQLYLRINNSDINAAKAKVKAGEWYNLTLIYRDGVATLLVDGQRVAAKRAALSYAVCGNNDTNIGTANYANGANFNGLVRNLKVYSFESKPAAPAIDANLIAHYPFKSDGKDLTGKQSNADVTKATFADGNARVLGQKGSGDAYSNQVQTPRIQGLNLNNFGISVEFFAVEATEQPIIVAGRSCRWLGAGINSEGKLYLLVNNSERTPTTESVRPRAWHTLELRYKGGGIQMTYDGKRVATKTATLNLTPCGTGDTNIGTANYGNAGGFNGYVRNLKVYSY